MSTVNYTDVGLSANNIASLKLPYRRTAWRAKILKSNSTKLFEPDTAVTDKIDDGTYYTPGTTTSKYLKMISDVKGNRTFILHNNALNSTVNPIVTIINHKLPTTDPDYLEIINKTTGISWPSYFGASNYAYDMDYNPDDNKLVLALPGRHTGATYVQPGIMTIDVAKTMAELVLNTCDELKPNPAYLTALVMSPISGYADNIDSAYTRYVRYYKGKYYIWMKSIFATAGWPADQYMSNAETWQLGYYTKSGVYTLVFQYGTPPRNDDAVAATRADGSPYSAAVSYPTQVKYPVISNYPANGSTDGAWGDSTMGLQNVVSFEIIDVDGGQILIGTTPTSTSTVSYKYGMEPFIYRISITQMQTELSEASRLIETKTVAHASSGGTVAAAVDTVSFSPDLSVFPLLNTSGGLLYVKVTATPIDLTWTYYPILRSDYGAATVNDNNVRHNPGSYCGYESSVGIFNYSNTISCDIDRGDVMRGTPGEFTFTLTFKLYKAIPGLVEVIGIHSTVPLCRSTDTDMPTTETANSPNWATSGYTLLVASRAYPTSVYNVLAGVLWSGATNKYIINMRDTIANTGIGLYIYRKKKTPSFYSLHRLNAATSDLAYDFIGAMRRLTDGIVMLGSGNPSVFLGDDVSVQFFNVSDETFNSDSFDAVLAWKNSTPVITVTYDAKHNRRGILTAVGTAGTGGEAGFYTPPLTDGVWKWDREIRTWWDGSNYDILMGAGGDTGGKLNQPWSFDSPSLSSSKGTASNQFNFNIIDFDYLPWNEDSEFNMPQDMKGAYDGGGLADGNRINLERGIFRNGVWDWIQEGTYFILKSPIVLEDGLVSMSVSCGGPISLLVTRGVYKGTHKPDEVIYTRVTMTSTDGLSYIYNDGTSDITDWIGKPPAEIYVDGVKTAAYTLTTASGIVQFPDDMSAKTIEATFTAYDPGTNEAEDIIICILRYPQSLGGCELDDSYFTRLIKTATLTTTDDLTFSFAKNNIVDSDVYNAIYVNGVLTTVGFTWNYRNGTVTFALSQAGKTITGDCKYYTIQKSGATLRPITLKPKAQKDSYDCINEVCRRVAPNYIFREGRDGKLECDFFTQKATASADLTIDTTTDIIVNTLNIDPIYEGQATRVISFGQAELDDLPNYCLGMTVTDVWPYNWHAGVDVQTVTDGDPLTGATSGYGRWSGGGAAGTKDSTYLTQQALIAAGVDGVPALYVDMTEVKEVETILISRVSQAANEGDAGAIQQISVWASNDATSWTKLVAATEIGPGQNLKFVAGTNFDEGTAFQYIRVNIHSLGLYVNADGNTDSQISIGEIQCYPSTTIEGTAVIQSDDPTADHYDIWGLLDKYGIINYVARGGEPDSMLYTQELADNDAGFVLDEITRLLNKVEIRAPWLPAIPIFSTIAITDVVMGTTNVYFVESRSASGGDGNSEDVYIGTTLP